jgi:hypothetical protein
LLYEKEKAKVKARVYLTRVSRVIRRGGRVTQIELFSVRKYAIIKTDALRKAAVPRLAAGLFLI